MIFAALSRVIYCLDYKYNVQETLHICTLVYEYEPELATNNVDK